MSNEQSSDYFVQSAFYSACSAAGWTRPLLARIGLAIADKGDYAVDVGSLFRDLNWSECQSVLALMSFRSNTAIYWSEVELRALQTWAEE